MFFSAELLSQRDSGFGLLWLAATLGSKSTFKKLPKRSVMTADISQLCGLIAQPAEPLALRLSSNLLVGAARVYKAKQDIFISDVTICFNTLKRVVQELHNLHSTEANLQMAQPTVRTSAVTLNPDPFGIDAMDLDAFVTNWDEYLDTGNEKEGAMDDGDHDEFNPKATKKNTKGRRKQGNSSAEVIRADTHTLNENHDHLLSSSADLSGAQYGQDMPPSQFGGTGFDFDDNFFGAGGLGIDDEIDDELARQLGAECNLLTQKSPDPVTAGIVDPDIDFMMGEADLRLSREPSAFGHTRDVRDERAMSAAYPAPQTPINERGFMQVADQFSPTRFGTPLVDAPMGTVLPDGEGTKESEPGEVLDDVKSPRVRAAGNKRRLHVDTKMELTNDEMKLARMHYVDEQLAQRRALVQKRFAKEHSKIIDEILCGAPGTLHTEPLVNFWKNHFIAQAEARSNVALPRDALRGRQRSRFDSVVPGDGQMQHDENTPPLASRGWDADFEPYQDMGGAGVDDHAMNTGEFQEVGWPAQNFRSSEEPGQARRISHALPGETNAPDLFGTPLNDFPWGDAGESSSMTGAQALLSRQSSDRAKFERHESRIGLDSLGRRRDSSITPVVGHAVNKDGHSVAPDSQMNIDDDFVFNVSADQPSFESFSASQINHPALDKDYMNFLIHARSLPRLGSPPSITFDQLAPKVVSSVRVAAAVLYHCLVLNTKGLIQVHQDGSYARIDIIVK